MPKNKARLRVVKTTFDEEQRLKDEALLKLTPLQRLRIHEQMRKRIWGELYGKVPLKGQRVIKKSFPK